MGNNYRSEAARRRAMENLNFGRGAVRWAGKLTIPQHAPKLVQQLFEIMNRDKVMLTEVCGKAGIRRATASNWRYKSVPLITGFDAMLNAMGYELRILPMREPKQ